MSWNILKLHPVDPDAAPDSLPALLHALRSIGLVYGDSIPITGKDYLPGPRFPELIAFVSSHIVVSLKHEAGRLKETGRSDSREHCQITLSEVRPEAEFLGMGNTENPQCPVCAHPIRHWPAILDAWYLDKLTYRWQCPNCSHTLRPADLNWHHTAAIARFTLDIEGIWQDEAYPSEELLDFLRFQTGFSWNYFFCRI